MAQYLGDNGDGSVAFDDGYGNRVNVLQHVAQAQGLMPPPSPIADPFAGQQQVQASPIVSPFEAAPPPGPSPMEQGAAANIAAMAPQDAPQAPEQAPAPAEPYVPRDAKGRPLKGSRALEAKATHAEGQADSIAMGALEQQKAGLEKQAAADSAEQLQVADAMAQRDQDLAVFRQQREVEKVREAEEKRSLGNGIASAVDARKSWRMDRGRLLKQMDGGSKALGFLSVLMGSLSQTMNKGQSNPAMDVLLQRIDQDANDQMQEYDQLGENVDESKSAYKEYLAQLGDKEAAFAATKADRIEEYKGQLEMIAARASSERVKTQALVAAAELDKEKAGIIGKTAERMWGRFESAKQREMQGAQLAESRRQFDLQRLDKLKAEEKAALAAGDSAKAAQLAEERKLGIGDLTGAPVKNKDGTSFLARSPESAIEIAKQAAATYGIATLAGQLEDGYKKYGAEFTKTDAYRQLQSTHAQMQIELKEAFKLGVLAGPDLELINRAIGTSDPTELRSYTKALRGLADNSVGRLETRMKADGFTGKLNVPTASSFSAPQDSKFKDVSQSLGTRKGPSAYELSQDRMARATGGAAGKALSDAQRDIASGKAIHPDDAVMIRRLDAVLRDPWASAADKQEAMDAAKSISERIRSVPGREAAARMLDKVGK